MPAEVALPENPAISPSGDFVLLVQKHQIDGNEMQNFKIADNNNTVVYESPDMFSVRDITFFLWDTENRVWVYSGDLGTFFWENQGGGKNWKKHVYAEGNVSAPQFLKEVRPRWHQK
jgi:hypothetical protein